MRGTSGVMVTHVFSENSVGESSVKYFFLKRFIYLTGKDHK